jgi:Transglycosylase SLT domain
MLVDPGSLAVGSTVAGAIRQASQATGTSFSYLLATAQVESGLNPQAGASTSSARGLFQFVEQTWLGTMKQSGAALGYGRYVDAITRTAAGHYEVKDPTLRSQILKLRNDPTANAVMAGAFTKANAAYLTQKLGRQPSEGELYIAHFLGAGGAARLISLGATNPYSKASELFAHAASANPSIFYDRKTGAARTIGQVRDILTARYDVARAEAPTVAQASISAPSSSVSAPLSLVPDTAGMTNAFAAAAPPTQQQPAPPQQPAQQRPAQQTSPYAGQDAQIFHGLFVDNGTAMPSASAVRQMWTMPLSSEPGAAAPPPASVAANLLDLFKDPVDGS